MTPSPPAHEAADRPPNRPHLMIVSGHEAARSGLHGAAQNSGLFQTIRAMADGRFALEHLSSSDIERGGNAPPDILLLDADIHGIGAMALLRAIRQSSATERMFVAVFAPRATPQDFDWFETGGADFIIRGVDPRSPPRALFRALVHRHAAKVGPAALAALNLSCGTLGGCGADVPAIA